MAKPKDDASTSIVEKVNAFISRLNSEMDSWVKSRKAEIDKAQKAKDPKSKVPCQSRSLRSHASLIPLPTPLRERRLNRRRRLQPGEATFAGATVMLSILNSSSRRSPKPTSGQRPAWRNR